MSDNSRTNTLEGFQPRRLSDDEPLLDYAPRRFVCTGAAIASDVPMPPAVTPARMPTVEPRAPAPVPPPLSPSLELPQPLVPQPVTSEPPYEPGNLADACDSTPAATPAPTDPSLRHALSLLTHAMRLLEQPAANLTAHDRMLLQAAETLGGRLCSEFAQRAKPSGEPAARRGNKK